MSVLASAVNASVEKRIFKARVLPEKNSSVNTTKALFVISAVLFRENLDWLANNFGSTIRSADALIQLR
jgi:hypothetical protein